MSYEGFSQVLCEDGHLSHKDDYSGDKEDCSFCGKKIVFNNMVDETNFERVGFIEDWSSLEISPEKRETCNLGHSHVVEAARYRIPSKEELENLQLYYDQDLDKFVLLKDRKDPSNHISFEEYEEQYNKF